MGGVTISFGSIFGVGVAAGLGLLVAVSVVAGIVGGIMYLVRKK